MEKVKKLLSQNRQRITNLCFVILFVLVFVLVIINQYNIQFWANGFDKLSGKALQVYYLDVGQANATLIILPTGRTMVVDTGSGESSASFIKSVSKILSENGLEEIDILVLTHSDEDHIGGAIELLEKYQVNSIYRPKLISKSDSDVKNTDFMVVETLIYEQVISAVYEEPNCDVQFIEDKVFVEGENCVIEFFSCIEERYSDTNSYCPFITIDFADKIFMFTGDATETREKEFLELLEREERNIDVDFLLVSHHGAKSSSTAAFLTKITPRYAIISAGDDLHPTRDVLERLKSCGVEKIYCTKDDGMIGIALQESGTFYIKTLSYFVDLPLFVCIIFVVIMLWNFYFSNKKRKNRFVGQNIF